MTADEVRTVAATHRNSRWSLDELRQMDDRTLEFHLNEFMADRGRLVERVKQCEFECSEINTRMKSRRHTPQHFAELMKARHQIAERKRETEKALVINRADVAALQREQTARDRAKQRIRPGQLDEFDLKNALVEPQNLLQLALESLEKTMRRHGATDLRPVRDAIHDYLVRQGISQ